MRRYAKPAGGFVDYFLPLTKSHILICVYNLKHIGNTIVACLVNVVVVVGHTANLYCATVLPLGRLILSTMMFSPRTRRSWMRLASLMQPNRLSASRLVIVSPLCRCSAMRLFCDAVLCSLMYSSLVLIMVL